jgi:hypothetical protein
LPLKNLEKVRSYKFRGSIVNGNNSVKEEVKELMSQGGKPHYANTKIFNSKLISMKTKLQLYWTIIRPVIKFASET